MYEIDYAILLEHFPGRSKASIREVMSRYEIRSIKNWTYDEDMFVKEKKEDGWTAKQIAAIMPNRSEEAVKHRIRQFLREHLTLRNDWTEEEKLYLKFMCDKLPVKEIAARLKDRTYNAVYQKLLRMGLTPQEKGWKNMRKPLDLEEVRAIKQRLDKGESQGTIAADFNVTPSSISRIKKIDVNQKQD